MIISIVLHTSSDNLESGKRNSLPPLCFRSCPKRICWATEGTGRWTMMAGWWWGWCVRARPERTRTGPAASVRTTALGVWAGLAPVTKSGTTQRTWTSGSPHPPPWASTSTSLPASSSSSWWRERPRRRCGSFTSSKSTSRRRFFPLFGSAQIHSAVFGKRISDTAESLEVK